MRETDALGFCWRRVDGGRELGGRGGIAGDFTPCAHFVEAEGALGCAHRSLREREEREL